MYVEDWQSDGRASSRGLPVAEQALLPDERGSESDLTLEF
jgi:hypothetical protein